jgi:hypothetical protein
MRQAAAALAVLMLGACTDLPDRVGTLGACAETMAPQGGLCEDL